MSRRRHHGHHRHFDPRHEQGVRALGNPVYGMAGYGWDGHDCLSGQQFAVDSCPAADAGAATGGTSSGTPGV